MINSDSIRGHLDAVILKLIIEKDMYGYEIANEIKERTKGAFVIKEATLYSIFKRLQQKKLITSYIGEKSHGSKRRYYRITILGESYYKEKKQEWDSLKIVLDSLLEEN